MALNRKFGRDLSDKLMNGTFAGARRGIIITQYGNYNPVTEAKDVLNKHTGICIAKSFSARDFQGQPIQDADVIFFKRCAEVIDDTTLEPFDLRNDNCVVEIEDLDPVTDASLGYREVAVTNPSTDGVNAVYTAYGKYK